VSSQSGMVTAGRRAFLAIPALLIMISIWKGVVAVGEEKRDLVVLIRVEGPDGEERSAWTGFARMLCVLLSWAAKVEVSSVEEEEV